MRSAVDGRPDAWPDPRAAYVHVPFCVHRCGYCNFTVLSGRDDLIEAFLEAVEAELRSLKSSREVDTLFLGGGTPTYLPPPALRRLLTAVQSWFPPAAGCEFSVEANPADLDAARVELLAEYGVTRISLGVQSFSPEKLRRLERDHGPEEIARSYELARRHVASVSIDLIFGCPGETLAGWERDVQATLELAPDHVSTYGLTFERGTQFFNRLQRGEMARLDEELEGSMYERAIAMLAAAGLEHYEVSNFARPGHRCRHNEVYWAGEGYYAAGPGASRYVGGRRETNHRSTTTYLRRVLAGQSPVAQWEQLSAEDRAREMLVLGLRRIAGVDVDEFARRTGFNLFELAGPAVHRHIEWGLLEQVGNRLRLTRQGLLLSDSLWPDYVRV
jgi:oxygen-independent coproporphyrinogen-3 oxidase